MLEIQAKRAYAEGGNRSLRTAARLLDDILRRKSLSGQATDVRLLLYSVQVNRELNQLGLAFSQLDQALESVPNEPTLLQNKLQILVLKRDWEQVLSLGQAMMDAEINFEASANAVQMAQDALEGRVTTSPLALEVQAILRRYDDGDREESLREMKAVYERDPQQFVVVVSYVRMLLVEEQRSLALEILDALKSLTPASRRPSVSFESPPVHPIQSRPLFFSIRMKLSKIQQQGRSPYFVTSSLCKPTQTQTDDLELAERVEK